MSALKRYYVVAYRRRNDGSSIPDLSLAAGEFASDADAIATLEPEVIEKSRSWGDAGIDCLIKCAGREVTRINHTHVVDTAKV